MWPPLPAVFSIPYRDGVYWSLLAPSLRAKDLRQSTHHVHYPSIHSVHFFLFVLFFVALFNLLSVIFVFVFALYFSFNSFQSLVIILPPTPPPPLPSTPFFIFHFISLYCFSPYSLVSGVLSTLLIQAFGPGNKGIFALSPSPVIYWPSSLDHLLPRPTFPP